MDDYWKKKKKVSAKILSGGVCDPSRIRLPAKCEEAIYEGVSFYSGDDEYDRLTDLKFKSSDKKWKKKLKRMGYD